VADSLPPTFIIRSWSHCHSSKEISECPLTQDILGHTVEVGRAHKGDVDTQIAVIRRAIETQVDAKWYRCPGRIVLPAVKAYL
jgi:hypothetical protein